MRAVDIQQFAPPEFDVDVVAHNPFVDEYEKQPEDLAVYDAVFSFSWTMSPLPLLKHAKRSVALCTCNGLLYDRQREGDWRSRITTASRNTTRARQRLGEFDGVVAVNRVLYEACLKHNPNTVLIPSGVNTAFWRPLSTPGTHDGPLRVGWAGQRRCNVKGLAEVLEPLRKACPRYDWRVNDRNFDEALTREEMLDWYNDLDVFVSTSIIEGTPSGPFEAAACGRLVLSTDVGVVSDWEYLRQRELVAPSYHNRGTAEATVEWFVDKLAEAERYRSAGRLEKIGNLLRRSVDVNFGYDGPAQIARKYLEFIAHGSQ